MSLIKKLSLLCILCSFTLTGCVPVILVAGATAGSAVLYDNRSFKQINIDATITTEARKRISANQTLKTEAHINVSVYNSIILLTGEASSAAMRAKAYELVSTIPNVHQIYNEIVLAAPISHTQRIKDSWITTKAKSAMLAKEGLRSTNIRVTTENGVVFLMGNVSHKQANLAADVVRRISDVKKVVKVFQYPV